MNAILSTPRERLFGLERRGALRAPQPGTTRSTRLNGGESKPRTLGIVNSVAPKIVRAAELSEDVWAFYGAEGFSFSSPLDWSRGISVSALVRMRSVAAAQILVASDNGVARSFSLSNNVTGFWRWQIHFGGATHFLQTPQTYAAGRWRWVTGTFGPGELRLAVDGTYLAIASGPASWSAPTTSLTIGWKNHVGQQQRLDGDLAWFGVWPRPLSNAEIRELHRRAAPPRFAGSRSTGPFPFPAQRAFPPLVPSPLVG